MKKRYSTADGVHYLYKGFIICREKERPSETKYSYRRIGHGYDDAGHARTLNLAMLWVDSRIEDGE